MTKNWKHTKRNYKCLLKRERHTLKWGLMLLLSICIIGGYGQSRSNHEVLFASTTGGEIAAGDNGGADVGDDVRLDQQGDITAEAIAVEETPSEVQEVVPPHNAPSEPSGGIPERQEIENYVREVFGEDAERAFKIIECESRWNPRAINDNRVWGGVGRDRGLWQINDRYHPLTDQQAFDYKQATDYAHRMFVNDGGSFRRWTCGRK